MDDDPQEIQRQQQLSREIDQTKADLVDKLEALENQVMGTVQSASNAVSETVDAVKDSVHTVVEKVKSAGEFFNVRRQAQHHPWAVFGTSVLAGCMTAYFLGGGRKGKSDSEILERMGQRYTESSRGTTPLLATSQPERPQSQPEPKEEKARGWFREELDSFFGLAVGSVMGLLRDVAVQELPEAIGHNLAQEMDKLTAHLGGKPIEGPILQSDLHQAA
jgi:hypothetical protein